MDELGPKPGWFVLLRGHQADLDQWQPALKAPFDPWVEQISHGNDTLLVLRSTGFQDAEDASQVRGRALSLLDRLNGAMAVSARAERVDFGGVGRLSPSGEVSMNVFAEAGNIRMRGLSVVAYAEARDAHGNLISPLPPEPSAAQGWVQASESNDDIADLLVYAGRADNWFDIYKAVEVAERIAGGEHGLKKLLGPVADRLKNMKSTANLYRHARRSYKPAITQDEARSLLASVVRTVISRATPGREEPC